MAVVFADPFGSYVEGLQEGQKFEQDYQEHALETFDDSMRLLDDLVIAPQRQLAKEQRQYARQLDMMLQRHQLARARSDDRTLGRQLDARAAARAPGAALPDGTVNIQGSEVGGTPVLGGALRIYGPGSGLAQEE